MKTEPDTRRERALRGALRRPWRTGLRVLWVAVLAAGCGGGAGEGPGLAGLTAGIAPKSEQIRTWRVGKPYRIRGRRYVPREDFSYRERGEASWYGHPFHGRRTASGAVYHMDRMTAAHRTLPLPSLVRVTNLENGRSVELLVNDRGPFARNRIIDVSRRAAIELGFHRKGTARVEVRILEAASRSLKASLAQGAVVGPSRPDGRYGTPGTRTARAGPWPLWGSRPWKREASRYRVVVTQVRAQRPPVPPARWQQGPQPLWSHGHGGYFPVPPS